MQSLTELRQTVGQPRDGFGRVAEDVCAGSFANYFAVPQELHGLGSQVELVYRNDSVANYGPG